MNFSHFQKRNKTNLSEPKVRNNINQDTIPSLGSNPLQKLFSIQGLDGGGKTSTYPGTPKGFMGHPSNSKSVEDLGLEGFFPKKNPTQNEVRTQEDHFSPCIRYKTRRNAEQKKYNRSQRYPKNPKKS